jgi:hypothetical protein
MLDHPFQFLLGLSLLLALLAWRFKARINRKQTGRRLPIWRRVGQGLLEIVAILVLLLVAIEATRYVGINFCVELWEGQNWCNHQAEDSPPVEFGRD